MSQIGKTLIFVGVAAVVVLAVIFSRPAALKQDADTVVGDKLLVDFDPLAATDLEIVEFNEATGQLQPFEVKQGQSKGKTVWTIPSHSDYPADAKDQVAQAAVSLLGLQILGVKGDSQDDHETFGVVDAKEKEGGRGIGMKVTLRDKKGKDLVSLIIGKEVPDQKGHRYVRLAGQKPVYVVEMKTDNLTTRFDRWIEKSLLQINAWDLSKLWIRDHSVDSEMVLHEHEEMVLDYNDKSEPHWKLLEDRQFDEGSGKWNPITMPADETLNTTRLDELKTALGELQIIDVERKPAGLSADLKASENFVKSQESAQALINRGFYLSKAGNSYELFSNNGEIRCMMNNGVEYILRFGDIALDSTAAGSNEEKAKDAKDGKPDEKKATGLNRYLFVMAQFNPAGIPKPEEKPLPGDQPAEGATPAAKETPAAPLPPAPTETKPALQENPKPADENKPAPEEEKKPVDAKPASYAGQNPTEDKPADTKPAGDKPAADKPADAQTPPAADQKALSEGPKAAEGQPAATATQTDENPIGLPTDPKALEAAREQVEKENKRKRDEYDEKVKAGKKKVEELNARFADWFYVISDETYRKIHLSHENLFIKKSEKKEEKPGQPSGMPPGMMGMPQGMPPVGE
jgi:hypothetical protein